MKLRDYRPSPSVDVLIRLAVSTTGESTDVGVGITMAIIALVDAETGELYSEIEISRHMATITQGYVVEWMRDPW